MDPAINTGTYLHARAAAALLGVKPATLYAYVSRGLVRSVESPGGRGRSYLRADLERLKARSDARAGHGPVAGAALRWGEPVLDSALTSIAQDGPRYRGHPAAKLAEDGTPFESVAELLWTGDLPPERPRWIAEGKTFASKRVIALLGPESTPLSAITLAVAALSARDPGRYGAPLATEHDRARAMVLRMAASTCLARAPERFVKASIQTSVAATLALALGGRAAHEAAHALDCALVLCADHELNVSTFAARITASAGADLYACLGAALAALSGPKHGGLCDRVEALVTEIGHADRTRSVIHDRTRRGEEIPGFGHRLYPERDPRAEVLLDLSRALGGRGTAQKTMLALVKLMREEGREPPTLDAGLVALTSALGLPPGSAVAIFAIGRAAGWIAHVFEQREDPHLLRPRARYVGP
jgi:citrate synthase